MSTHANMVKMGVTSVGADPYTITLGAASSGYQHINAAITANATVDILITMGTTWEVARDCTYTYNATPTSCTITRGTLESSSTGSRITTFDNTAVVSVVATAAFGNNAALNHVAASPTTAGVTGVVGTMHLLDISGLTATRNFTLPATAAVGDRVGVYITAGDDSYALVIIGDTGDTINGGSAATEWSRLFIANECVILRCITANSAWVVEYDGRLTSIAGMLKTTSTTVADTTETKIAVNEVIIDNAGGQASTGSNRLDIRRSGNYQLQGALSASGVAITGAQVRIHKNGAFLTLSATDLPAAGGQVVVGLYSLIAGDYLELFARHASGANRDYYGASADPACSIRIMEVL